MFNCDLNVCVCVYLICVYVCIISHNMIQCACLMFKTVGDKVLGVMYWIIPLCIGVNMVGSLNSASMAASR